MEKQVKELEGHSGSKIYLIENDHGLIVRKIGDNSRNIERMNALYSLGYPIPKIFNIESNSFDMEYVHGLDMKNYLRHNNVNHLSKFLINTLYSFSSSQITKDYTETYYQKLEWMDKSYTEFPFTKEQLIDKLPKKLPQSVYHGDMTLENIIATENTFYMIDAVKIEYDSYIFDIAKMRQDMECKWFIRKHNIKLDVKLKNLQDRILREFPLAKNDHLLILMLLRVFRHTQKEDDNYNFVVQNIRRLWENSN